VIWHGTLPGEPDFSGSSRTLAMAYDGSRTGREPDRDIYIAFNAWQEPLRFVIPYAPQGRPWRRVVDTSLAAPQDIVGLDEGPRYQPGATYTVAAHSLIVLVGEG
jgi:glycogen operon protein